MNFILLQQQLIHQLLGKNVLLLAEGPGDYGFTDTLDHPIHTGDTVLIQEQYHNIPPGLCQEAKELLHNMLQSGIIGESRSLWAAPVLLI